MPLTAGASTAAASSTLERHTDLGSVRGEWDELARRSGNVFMTWEWADAWYRHLGGRLPLITLLARRSDGTAQGVLPLYVSRTRPVRVLRFVGAGPSDELGPICAPEDRAATARLLRHHSDGLLSGGGVLLAERVGRDPAIASDLGGVVVARASTPVAQIGGRTFDEYLATRSAHFRHQLRHHERRLLRTHRLHYRLTSDLSELERDMNVLTRLHGRRWRRGESRAFAGARRDFHLDFARSALRQGWLRLWTLELDGQPAAMVYSLRFGDVDHFYQTGRDPRFESLSVGFVLVGHTIRCACEDGVREYRFGLGNEAYKSRFCHHDPGLETLAIGRGWRGKLALASLRVGLRARGAARERGLLARAAL